MSITASPQQTSTADAATRGSSLRLVETVTGDEHRHRHRNAFRDEEHDLQGHALALESHCLRRRAERQVQAMERGATPVDTSSILRAFRAYRPFVFAADRIANDAARRRLAHAVSAARTRRDVAALTPDASVA